VLEFFSFVVSRIYDKKEKNISEVAVADFCQKKKKTFVEKELNIKSA